VTSQAKLDSFHIARDTPNTAVSGMSVIACFRQLATVAILLKCDLKDANQNPTPAPVATSGDEIEP
jgi:hypothetical protein